jgi:site-specific DNA-adenine methylase
MKGIFRKSIDKDKEIYGYFIFDNNVMKEIKDPINLIDGDEIDYNNENNFMFLDPPYDSEFTDYGYCQFDKSKHELLAKCFKETKIKCLMIIGKTEFIENLYKDYIVGEYDKSYKFKLYDGRIGDDINTQHLVIKNW